MLAVLAGSLPPPGHHMGPLECFWGSRRGKNKSALRKSRPFVTRYFCCSSWDTAELSLFCLTQHIKPELLDMSSGCFETGFYKPILGCLEPDLNLGSAGFWNRLFGIIPGAEEPKMLTKLTQPRFLSPPKFMTIVKPTLNKRYLASDANWKLIHGSLNLLILFHRPLNPICSMQEWTSVLTSVL